MRISLHRRAGPLVALAALAAAVALGACAERATMRPAKLGDVDTGPGSVEAVRRQLKGTWTLTSYEVYQSGRRQKLNASAELKYDEFGNLTLRGELKQPAAGTDAHPALLNYSGKAVIDAGARELHLIGVERSGDRLAPTVAAQVSAANVRHYELTGSTLKLTVTGPDGQPTAVSAWKKAAG